VLQAGNAAIGVWLGKQLGAAGVTPVELGAPHG